MYEGVSFIPLTWTDMRYLAPEFSLAAAFLILILLDLLLPKRVNRISIGWLTLAGILVSLLFVVLRMIDMNIGGASAEAIHLLGNSYRIDDFASLLKLVFLTGTALIVLLALGSARDEEAITDKSEYYYMLLPALIGAMMMASSGNLVTLYIGLELLSLTSYVLVGMRRKSLQSAEAAFKYVVTGGISSAMVLFGMSYIYGITGSVDLGTIAEALPRALNDFKALAYVGFFFMIAGFGIKIAAAPFHAWAPDVYQGAPTPVSAFLAVVAKGAALAAIFRIIFSTALIAVTGDGAEVFKDVFFAILVIAAAAMLVGTTTALRQKNMKRLLALSGVANAGYMLVPIGISITVVHSSNFSEFVYYLVAYLFMTIGAFAVFTVVSKASLHDEIKGFAGMYYRAPWTAAAMVIFVLSLAGLPVSGGFFGKLFILLGAASAKAYWLVAIMVISSVISYYFYFGLVRQMFMRSGNDENEIRIPGGTAIVIWLCVAATIALGLFPGPLMEWIDAVFSIKGDLMLG
ncbi:NADH-quinone oxidoreductase subunit N [Bacillus sp. FJAT-26390]|uniref:NADH-quinone oxidoreductase subunit N n=1 Tax=Bacillus sp. FJAT-26390 TaxID=1743142 RepID=UPI000807B4EB|nr:NADH-quinone oxidoreductase subunit N [Bacillus sp. FJAT-26390]OBZ09985.1 NADH:ubiquinone oxidoreductase subunit N [Bacillus sp. FJAT-26390]